MPSVHRLAHRLRRFAVPAALVWLSACGRSAPVVPVSPPAGAAHEPSLAVFDDGMAVAWYDTRDERGDLYLRALDASGIPVGPELALTRGPNDAYEADAHAVRTPDGGSGLALGWYEKTREGRLLPRVGVWTRAGARRWSKAVGPAGRNTVVRVAGSLLFVAWVMDEPDDRASVWGGWWTVAGDVREPPRRLADAGRTTWNLNAAVDPASTPLAPHAWLVFDAKAGTRAEELFVVEVRGDGLDRVERLTADDGKASKYPDLAFAGDAAALTWFDERDGNQEVYLSIVPRARVTGAADSGARRVTTTTGHSIGAYLAWNGDRLGLAWCDDTVGQHEVYAQTFSKSGTPLEPARRLTDTTAASLIPAIRAWRSGFVLAWNEYDAQASDGHAAGARSQVVATRLP